MAEGWKQLFEDISRALGWVSTNHPAPSEVAKDQSADSVVVDDSSTEESDQQLALEVARNDESEQVDSQEAELQSNPPSAQQKMFSSAGVVVTLVLAVGVGWYIYFGGPKPPAPDVVATFDGGQITLQDVQEHLAILAPEDSVVFPPTYENYRSVVEHMLLNELVRRWASEQKMDASARFKDAMRHISESVTLDEWISTLHKDEMLSAVSESEIEAYYEANLNTFGNKTLDEVREQIRQTLAHENQEKFFED